MDSPQSVISSHKNSIISTAEKPDQTKPNGNQTFTNNNTNTNPNTNKDKNFIGVLNVYIHSARDILNICIYHKQDVYSKLSLVNDPDSAVNSKLINGGGQNPVFDDQVSLNVSKIDTSLKCEIWMMSRVRNYLEDQLLGFALVPLSEVLISEETKLSEREFTLSSTDLFHSPSGFVKLSIDYVGAKPEVLITDPNPTVVNCSEISPIASELDKIEFPDPKIVNEDEIMVSEYLSNPCNSLESSDAHNGTVDHFVESTETVEVDSPSVDSGEVNSEKKEDNNLDPKEAETDFLSGSKVKPPIVSVEIESEPKLVQQDIVDMYMKSMQQFTESLAKMKLPLDVIDTGAATSAKTTDSVENSSSGLDPKAQTPKSNKVFYGSRAFF